MMKNYKLRNSIALFALFLLLSGVSSLSLAQGAAPHDRLEAGWRKSTDLLNGILSPAQQSEMNVLAYSAAVAGLCDGFSLDKEKFMSAMNMMKHDSEADMSAEQIEYFENHLTFNYGVAVGLYLAEGSMDSTGFCATATAQRSDPETGVHYWE